MSRIVFIAQEAVVEGGIEQSRTPGKWNGGSSVSRDVLSIFDKARFLRN